MCLTNWCVAVRKYVTHPPKPGTSCKTCFWVNSHKMWLAQNYFQIFKLVFSCLLSGEQCILSNAWKNLFKWDFFFQTINDGLSLLIPIYSCSKWKTNWPISKKCSEAKICRCHIQNQPYLEKYLCYKHDLQCHFKAYFEVVHLILKVENVTNDPVPGFVGAGHIYSSNCTHIIWFWKSENKVEYIMAFIERNRDRVKLLN